MFQGREVSNSEYLEKFVTAVAVVQQFGGDIMTHNAFVDMDRKVSKVKDISVTK